MEYASSCSSSTNSGLTHEHLKEFARSIKDKKDAKSFHWFANHVQLFTFQTHDQLTLQAYFIPSIKTNATNQQVEGDNELVFLHCVGYIESTVKYASYLHQIHALGFDIYSFDLRYQGFSHNYPVQLQSTISTDRMPTSNKPANGDNDETISHLSSSFQNTFVYDLELFIKQFIHPKSKRIIYSGNSMSGLIGLLLQSKTPIFEKIILATPAIMPRVPTVFHYLLYFLTNIEARKLTAARFETDMHNEKLTHCPKNLELWILLHSMFPRQFKVVGMTFGFIYEFVKAGYEVLSKAHTINIPLLFLQASDDSFVDNHWMNRYFLAVINSPSVKMLRYQNTYHEILTETDEILEKIMIEINLFLK